MLAVVMEKGMRDTKKWEGTFGAALMNQVSRKVVLLVLLLCIDVDVVVVVAAVADCWRC